MFFAFFEVKQVSNGLIMFAQTCAAPWTAFTEHRGFSAVEANATPFPKAEVLTTGSLARYRMFN
jgi:hypothetical protein